MFFVFFIDHLSDVPVLSLPSELRLHLNWCLEEITQAKAQQ